MSDADLVPDDEWSAPESEVMASIRRGIEADSTPVLATVVGVEGSAYRGPGAKMLVADDTGLGSITAGCLEDVLIDLAAEVRTEGQPRVERFDLTGDDDVWGLGVGCNGIIDVLLEPLDGSLRSALDAYDDGRESLVYTVVDADHAAAPVGARAVAVGDDPTPAAPPEWFGDDLASAARECRRAGDSKTVECPRPGGRIEVFVDHVTPPADLVVFGHSHRPTALADGDGPTLLNPGSHAEPRGKGAAHAELEATPSGLDGRIVTPAGDVLASFSVPV